MYVQHRVSFFFYFFSAFHFVHFFFHLFILITASISVLCLFKNSKETHRGRREIHIQTKWEWRGLMPRKKYQVQQMIFIVRANKTTDNLFFFLSAKKEKNIYMKWSICTSSRTHNSSSTFANVRTFFFYEWNTNFHQTFKQQYFNE